MSLKEVLEKSLREAMLSKNNVKRDTIRMALRSLKQLEKDSRKEAHWRLNRSRHTDASSFLRRSPSRR